MVHDLAPGKPVRFVKAAGTSCKHRGKQNEDHEGGMRMATFIQLNMELTRFGKEITDAMHPGGKRERAIGDLPAGRSGQVL